MVPYKKFKYGGSIKINHWGYLFDSLLEFRFALSIQHEYSFLRSPVPIYYDPRTKKPTAHLRTCTKRYTPDFLIRHKNNGDAWWIEIKPKSFNDTGKLDLNRRLAESYIKWKNYDWQFRIIFDDEIILNEQQKEFYDHLLKTKSLSFLSPPSPALINFVMFGKQKDPPTYLRLLSYPPSEKKALTTSAEKEDLADLLGQIFR